MVCGKCIEDRSDSSVNVCQKEYQRKGDADEQYGALDKVGPEYGFQAAGVGIDDCDHTHDDDQQVDADSGQASQYHTGQVHDDGHTSYLVNDKHDRAQYAEPLAFEPQLQIMIGRINIQLAVDRQEKLDGQRDGKQHTELCEPHDPGPRVGISCKRQERYGA